MINLGLDGRRLTKAQGRRVLSLLENGQSVAKAARDIGEAFADVDRWLVQYYIDLAAEHRASKRRAKVYAPSHIYGGAPIGNVEEDRLRESEAAAAAFAGAVFSDAKVPPEPLVKISIPPTIDMGHCSALAAAGMAGSSVTRHRRARPGAAL